MHIEHKNTVRVYNQLILILLSFTVRLELALPIPTVEEMLTGLACQRVSCASWSIP